MTSPPCSRQPRSARTALGALLFWACALPSFAALPLSPSQLESKAKTILDQCTRKLRCDTNACASNGGLASCYGRASGVWAEHTALLEKVIGGRDPWCASHWAELREKHATFAESALASKTLADAPYNTNDDLRLLLAQQEYEYGYRILANSACRRRMAKP